MRRKTENLWFGFRLEQNLLENHYDVNTKESFLSEKSFRMQVLLTHNCLPGKLTLPKSEFLSKEMERS